MNVFEGINGQEQVCGYLQAALGAGRTTHAYLLVGPAGSEHSRADLSEGKSRARKPSSESTYIVSMTFPPS